MKNLSLAAIFTVLAAPAFAEGDVAAGEEQFARQCTSCHVVSNADGEVLAGRNAKTGPNLYGVAGQAIGSVEGFRYSDGLVAAGEADMVWEEESFVGYVQDPTGWLREATDDKRARGRMAYKVRDEQQAVDMYAYLLSLQ